MQCASTAVNIDPQIPYTYHTRHTYILLYYITTLYITFWYYFCRTARPLTPPPLAWTFIITTIFSFYMCRDKQQKDYCLLTCFMAVLLSLYLGIFHRCYVIHFISSWSLGCVKNCHHVKSQCACVKWKEAGQPLHLIWQETRVVSVQLYTVDTSQWSLYTAYDSITIRLNHQALLHKIRLLCTRVYSGCRPMYKDSSFSHLQAVPKLSGCSRGCVSWRHS